MHLIFVIYTSKRMIHARPWAIEELSAEEVFKWGESCYRGADMDYPSKFEINDGGGNSLEEMTLSNDVSNNEVYGYIQVILARLKKNSKYRVYENLSGLGT